MRKVSASLLKIILIMAFFLGCDKMVPHWEQALVPLWKEPSFEESFRDDSQEPTGPAVLIEVIPTNASIVQFIGGIALAFNKKPKNFRTDPPLEFYFADEAEGELKDRKLQIFQELKRFIGFYPLDTTVYITSAGIPFIHQSNQVNHFIDIYWAPRGVVRSELPDCGVSIIDVYWGTESPQQSAKLGYIITGAE